MDAYNCSNSPNSAYGAGAYGTCTNQSVGAPDTGLFQQVISSGSFSIIAPLVVAIIVVVIASAVIWRRKKTSKA